MTPQRGDVRSHPSVSAEVAELLRTTFSALSPRTQEAIVVLLASASVPGNVRGVVITDEQGPGPTLEDVLASVPAARTRGLVDRALGNLGTVSRLRERYQRAPGLAQGAVDRACATGLWTAGVPRRDASMVARALLRLGAEDWEHLSGALARLDEHLPAAS